ncbi:MAG: ATP-dependent RNA helicase HrpA, partial [Lentisphaeria bacterium]|nr:ATP-dependent RNA helicase HrpA [Lentisphaeria bacterium]
MNIYEVPTHYIGKLISLERNIQKRKQRKQPIDVLEKKLHQFLAESKAKIEKVKQTIGVVSLVDDLPISQKEIEIVGLLRDNQVLIIAGETGCGKTTQLPKMCLKAGFGARGLIAHTQPRRLAATSVAKRIAEELNTELGNLVGYSIRFNNKVSSSTRLKLMTDGVLLSEIEKDPLLSRYDVIIIDEAHERSLNIDFLLGFLTKILIKRRDLKLIITSATIDPERFSKHFNNAPMVTVEGRSYPVEVRYRPIDDDNDGNSADILLQSIVNAVDECILESTGNILIFADGEGQIKSIIKNLKQSELAQVEILPLYARLSISEQQKIFSASSRRKIIVSTNV